MSYQQAEGKRAMAYADRFPTGYQEGSLDRTPLPGHDPGTWDKPGCTCPDCTWVRLAS